MARRARRRTATTRYFVLRRGTIDTNHVFTGRQPRQAALKAATRGFTDITLRERGTRKLHMYTGRRTRVKAPSNAPSWMPRQIWKSVVRKKGVRHL